MRQHPITRLRSERGTSRLEMTREIYDATEHMVYHRTVQQWERGVNNPTFSNLARLSATYGHDFAMEIAAWHLQRYEEAMHGSSGEGTETQDAS